MCIKFFKPVYLLLLLVAFSCTSCIDILENILLAKDGSGKYELVIDMSGMLKDPMLKELIKQGGQDTAGSILSRIGEIDSSHSFKQMALDRGVDNPEFWERVSGRITTSEKNGVLVARIMLDFKNTEEIAYMMKNLESVSGDFNSQNGGIKNFLPANIRYVKTKNELERVSLVVDAPEQSADMEMMKALMTTATYRTRYQLPRKIRKSTIVDAKVDGNVLEAQLPLSEIMDGKSQKLDGVIRY